MLAQYFSLLGDKNALSHEYLINTFDMFCFVRGHKDKIYVIKWNPHETGKIVTVGVKHIKFWSQTGELK